MCYNIRKYNIIQMLNLEGKIIGDFEVIEKVEPYISPKGARKHRYKCVCTICGKEMIKIGSSLVHKTKPESTCNHSKFINKLNSKNKSSHSEYNLWYNMIRRCDNKNHSDYYKYGARGIKVCKEWYDFDNFLKDMGSRPKGYSIERIDVNKGYSPSNCKWIEHRLQSRNKRNTILSKEKSLEIKKLSAQGYSVIDLAEKYGCSTWSITNILNDISWVD